MSCHEDQTPGNLAVPINTRFRLKSNTARCLCLLFLFCTNCKQAHPAPITNTKGISSEASFFAGTTDWSDVFNNTTFYSSGWTWTTSPPIMPPAQSWNFDPRKDDLLNWDPKLGTDNVDAATSIVEVIVYIIISLVILSFVSFLICICCPICVLAKMRHSRRGHVYARSNPISNGTTNVIVTNPNPQVPQVIAIANQRTSAPYPVQETVTVIPLIQPFQYQYAATGINQNVTNFKANSNQNGLTPTGILEPPPPYSGPLPVNTESHLQQPFNPYFAAENSQNLNSVNSPK